MCAPVFVFPRDISTLVDKVVWELVVTTLEVRSIRTVFAGPVVASRFVVDLIATIEIITYERWDRVYQTWCNHKWLSTYRPYNWKLFVKYSTGMAVQLFWMSPRERLLCDNKRWRRLAIEKFVRCDPLQFDILPSAGQNRFAVPNRLAA